MEQPGLCYWSGVGFHAWHGYNCADAGGGCKLVSILFGHPMSFNFVAGLITYALGWFLLGVVYGQPYCQKNPWKEAWLYTGAGAIALIGGLAILSII